jgi:hypothetical protein
MERSIAVCFAMIVVLASCALALPKESRYLRDAQGRDSQEQVRQHLGPPAEATIGAGGNAVWIHRLRKLQSGDLWTSTGVWCDEYVLIFDDRHWTHKSKFCGGELTPNYCRARRSEGGGNSQVGSPNVNGTQLAHAQLAYLHN